MKDEPTFKSLQGNPAFFLVRAFPAPLYLRKKKKGMAHIPIAEGKLSLRCFWKVGLPLHAKTGNQLSSRDDVGARSFPRVAVLKLMFL